MTHNRSTTDLLILMVAGTVCFSVLAAGGSVVLVEFIHPETDTTLVVGKIGDVINTLIGLLAGFLAGRTQHAQEAMHQALDNARRRHEQSDQ